MFEPGHLECCDASSGNTRQLSNLCVNDVLSPDNFLQSLGQSMLDLPFFRFSNGQPQGTSELFRCSDHDWLNLTHLASPSIVFSPKRSPTGVSAQSSWRTHEKQARPSRFGMHDERPHNPECIKRKTLLPPMDTKEDKGNNLDSDFFNRSSVFANGAEI